MEVIVTTNSLTKRRSRGPPQTPPWADLPMELLELIVAKLFFFNIPRFKSICSSWHRAANSYLDSPLNHSQTPLLMIPSPFYKQDEDEDNDEDEQDEESISKRCICFYSLKDKTVYEFKNAPNEFHKSRCVGSSRGCLILLDKHANPYLLDVFSRSLIKLPPKETFSQTKSVSPKPFEDGVMIPSPLNPYADFQNSVSIQKAVLSDNNIVMIIYGHRSNLGYCRQSDSVWTYLQSLNIQGLILFYTDIICFNNKLYALDCDGFIEVWNFNGSVPVKEFDIQPTTEPGSSPGNYFTLQLYAAHRYLVESLGDILLVVRYVDEFVRDREPADRIGKKDTLPIRSYGTTNFWVYKLNLEREKWVKLESLGERALFLVGNHSVSLSVEEHRECKGNSIYFTDNFWDWTDEDYSHGGHDMGVFSLEDGSIKQFYEIDEMMKLELPPFWVFPCTQVLSTVVYFKMNE